jgi:hypothetical protein
MRDGLAASTIACPTDNQSSYLSNQISMRHFIKRWLQTSTRLQKGSELNSAQSTYARFFFSFHFISPDN